MSRSYSFHIANEPEAVVEKARAVAKASGGWFDGDTVSGSFGGRGVEGRYAVEGRNITVTITKKPLVAPWALVESEVRKFFA